jgi:hypothetical protein
MYKFGEPKLKKFMHIFIVLLLAFCNFTLYGCSGATSGDAWRYDPGIPGQVTGLKGESGDRLVTLSWSGNPVATSYRIYYVSELTNPRVTKANGNVINTTFTSIVIKGLDNNIKYHFMVTALNRDGESVESMQVSSTPGPVTNADLAGSWYFHTLVTGPDAKWERGTMTVTMASDGSCNAVISDFEDSSGNIQLPPGFSLSVNGSAEVSQSGPDPVSRNYGFEKKYDGRNLLPVPDLSGNHHVPEEKGRLRPGLLNRRYWWNRLRTKPEQSLPARQRADTLRLPSTIQRFEYGMGILQRQSWATRKNMAGRIQGYHLLGLRHSQLQGGCRI